MRVEKIISYQLCVPSSQDSFEAGLIPRAFPFPLKEIEAQGPEGMLTMLEEASSLGSPDCTTCQV